VGTPPQAQGPELPNNATQRERIRELTACGPTGRLRHCLTAGIEIRGLVDEEELRERIGRLTARRPALGSVFTGADTHRPVSGEPPRFRRQLIDGITSGARWAVANDIADSEAYRPFRFGEHPLVRGTLLTTEEDRHLLVVNADQLVCDAWSANLVVNDLLADDHDAVPDAYPSVWQAREDWLRSPAGITATQRRSDRVSGAWRRWPVPLSPDPGAADEVVERFVAVDDNITLALRDRVRRVRGSLLAVGAAAFAISTVSEPSLPLALTSSLAGRESAAEEDVVGCFANEAVLAMPPRRGTVAEYLTVVRGEIFAALQDQRVPYGLLRSALHDGYAGGPSCALTFLPKGLSGGETVPARLGGAVAIRTALSTCPTSADIDLFMIEEAPPNGDGARTLLRLGASGERAVVGEATVERLLEQWAAAITVLAEQDWRGLPVTELAAFLPGGQRCAAPLG
jgi:hypothetical protein